MVVLKTNYGDISLELLSQEAPLTVKNFLEYAESDYYNNTVFHRVINNFMVQGGGFESGLRQKKTNPPVQNEAGNRISNDVGTVAMARTPDPHSATSQFFINVNDNHFLNYQNDTAEGWGYCVFAKVAGGMDIVEKMKTVPTQNMGLHQDVPVEDIVILEVVVD
ncbi:MAG: peptidyl-prolyl cis-trans isomerase [Bdellovibrionaceae bacterium]|jgi:peptidyl-prolyl cis-trans isomerase B (cyclophilin B)|nr:peptidyl-prolyl cis-trans isomerase [Pseudobdellovibrionaceae bacterium]